MRHPLLVASLRLSLPAAGLVLCAAPAASGCQSGQASSEPSDRAAKRAAPPPKLAERAAPPTLRRGPTGGADLAAFVQGELVESRRLGRTVVVYVGASWCEPCRRFHDALEAKELDGDLAGVDFIEMDLDADGDALRRAGYVSDMIPLFALPRGDGTSSGRHVEGSIKGPGAVRRNLLPRLRGLLADGPRAALEPTGRSAP